MDLSKLFWSKCRKKLLEKFILERQYDEESGFFIRELGREIGEQVNSVRRELQNLEELGILRARSHDKKKVYRVNEDCPVIKPLKEIFLAYFDAMASVRTYFKDKKGIDLLVIAKEISDMSLKATNNTVDIFMVGEIDKTEFNDFLARNFFGRKIRYAVMSIEDLRHRLSYGDKLVINILRHKNNEFLRDSLGIREELGISTGDDEFFHASHTTPQNRTGKLPSSQFRMPL